MDFDDIMIETGPERETAEDVADENCVRLVEEDIGVLRAIYFNLSQVTDKIGSSERVYGGVETPFPTMFDLLLRIYRLVARPLPKVTEASTQTEVIVNKAPIPPKKLTTKEKSTQTTPCQKTVSRSTSTMQVMTADKEISTEPAVVTLEFTCQTDDSAESSLGLARPKKELPQPKDMEKPKDIKKLGTDLPPRNPELSPHVVVLKGVPLSASLQDIATGLEGNGIRCLKISRLRSRKTLKKIKPIAVVLPEPNTKVFHIKNLCGYFVKVEPLQTLPRAAPRQDKDIMGPPLGFADRTPQPAFEIELLNYLRRLLLQPG